MSNLDQLRQNLEGYVRRFYLNQFLKGLVLSLIMLCSAWLFIAILEYFGNFTESTRAFLFYSFLALGASLIVFRIAKPMAQMNGLLSRKNFSEAAREIGGSLETVEDKLINTLALQAMGDASPLLLASLNQKAADLNRFDFAMIINIREVTSLLKYLIIPAFVFITLSVWNPAIINDSSLRVIEYNRSFAPPAPFTFRVENGSLNVAEGVDFILHVQTSGNQLPEHVFIDLEDDKIRMKKLSSDRFEYTFQNVRSNIEFELNAAGITSEAMLISVLPLPKLLRSRAFVDYPEYTGLKDEELLNRNQFKVPEGSKISWSFDLKNVDQAMVFDPGSAAMTELRMSDGLFFHDLSINESQELTLAMKNGNGLTDSSLIRLTSIPDDFPDIDAKEMFDSTFTEVKYFSGEISDDYGFRKLVFNANILDKQGVAKTIVDPIDITPNTVKQQFNFIFNLNNLELQLGQSIEYFFEVWDNDEVNGSKSARSAIWEYKVPSLEELSVKGSQQAEKSKSSMENELSELEKMDMDLEQLRKELLQKKRPDWQDQEKLKEMLEKQRKMMEKLERKSEEQRRQNELNNRFMEYSDELIEKQEQIQEMFENLFDEEYKQKYQEMQELMEKMMNKDQLLDKVDQMKLDNEQLEKELDRTLELFKQLEFEQKLEETIQKTDALSQKQEELKEKTGEKNADSEKLMDEQSKLQKETEQLKKDLEKLEELNQALEDPMDIPDVSQDAQDASESMQKAGEELQKKNKNKSQQQQDQAKDALDKASKSLSQAQQDQNEEQHQEDLADMRQLLENLIDLSKEQESIMDDLKGTSARDPKFVDLAKRQKDIIDDTKVVEDSILALSKRAPMISRVLNDEISEVKHSMAKSLDNMTNQRPNQERQHQESALVNQQLSMTSLNNLAVLFDNLIQNMQKQMNSKMKGNGSCNKPGSGKSGNPQPSAGDMKKMQEQLNKQLEQLKEAMEKGKKPNGKKPGEKPGMGSGGMSKELAQMAAQQAAIREQLRELSNSIEKNGNQPGTQLKELQKLMEQTEEDLLYQNITQQTLTRQQEILSKLLESEKAERERELDNERKSNSSSKDFEIPADIWEKYSREKEKELELYKTLPPNLKPYYRKEVNRYFSTLQD